MSSSKMHHYYDLKNEHLPRNFNHHILKPENEDEEDYVLRANIKSISEIDVWLSEFSLHSRTQWNRRDSKPNGSQKIW